MIVWLGGAYGEPVQRGGGEAVLPPGGGGTGTPGPRGAHQHLLNTGTPLSTYTIPTQLGSVLDPNLHGSGSRALN